MIDSLAKIRSRLVSKFYSFRESFLFYPVVLAISGFTLFLATSHIDEIYDSTFHNENNAIINHLEPFFFAGSPNAARSILSTIAAGWATILGVAFSVTLITLQLSVTKYTTEIINEFRNSRTNQFTLGMFIMVVVFSLLVLKTVRTGEEGFPSYTPILGVNISVYLAVIVLFIFVVFLDNISSYLKPDTLINRILAKSLRSIKRYERRIPDRDYALDIQKSGNQQELIEIRAPREGVIRSIDWQKISDRLTTHSELKKLEQKPAGLFMDWLSVTGDRIEKNEVIARLYVVGWIQPENMEQNEYETIEQSMRLAVVAGLDVGPDRRILSDPHYGIAIMRNMAVRAIGQSDIATAESCILGLFRIFHYAEQMKLFPAVPFSIPLDSEKRHILIISSGEKDITEAALDELSVVYETSSASECKSTLAQSFAKNYTSYSKLLLVESNTEGFNKLTRWYSKQSSIASSIYSEELRKMLREVLAKFREDVRANYSYAASILQVYTSGLFTPKDSAAV